MAAAEIIRRRQGQPPEKPPPDPRWLRKQLRRQLRRAVLGAVISGFFAIVFLGAPNYILTLAGGAFFGVIALYQVHRARQIHRQLRGV